MFNNIQRHCPANGGCICFSLPIQIPLHLKSGPTTVAGSPHCQIVILPPLPPSSKTRGIYYKFMIVENPDFSGHLGPFWSSPDWTFIEVAAGITSNYRILSRKWVPDVWKNGFRHFRQNSNCCYEFGRNRLGQNDRIDRGIPLHLKSGPTTVAGSPHCQIVILPPLPPSSKTRGIYYKFMIFENLDLSPDTLDRFDLVRIEFSSKLPQELRQTIEYCPGNESQTFGKMDFDTSVKIRTVVMSLEEIV